MSDLVKRLDIKAGVMEMGERIPWGSDTALMREAAWAIEAKDKRIAELSLANDIWRRDFAALQAENARLRGVLTRIRDCDWVISLPDRMDAVRDIAKSALLGGGDE